MVRGTLNNSNFQIFKFSNIQIFKYLYFQTFKLPYIQTSVLSNGFEYMILQPYFHTFELPKVFTHLYYCMFRKAAEWHT